MSKLKSWSIVATAVISLAALAGCLSWASSDSDEAAEQIKQEQDAERVTVLFVADLHAQLEEHPELFWSDDEEDRIEMAGGFARLSNAIEQIRQQRDGDVLVVDGGDTIQGSGEAALTEGQAIIEPTNELGLDAGIPGNWSVAYGAEAMIDLLGSFDHQIFADNVYDGDTGERLYDPYIVRDVGGVRVGIIGYTDPDVPTRQPPAYSDGLTYTGPENIPQHIETLQSEEDADVVLLLSHIGLSKAVALTDDLPDFDVHLSSDTHERTHEPIDRDGTWVVEPGAFGSFIGQLDLWVEDGEVVDRDWELVEVTAEQFDQDPDVLETVADARAPVAEELDEELGYTNSELARYNVIETSLDNLLADALRDTTGTDIALSNGFRFGHPVPEGPITEADLWRFYPIVTNLKTGEVTGAQLRGFWESELNNVFAEDPEERFGGWVPRPSGMSMTFEYDAPAGERVREIRVDGEPIDDDEVYTLTACEREGEPDHTLCRIPNAANTEVHEVNAHQAVRQYLRDRDHVESSLESRIDAVDLPSVVRTQMLGID